jgi:PAS domain S-box-containing protein
MQSSYQGQEVAARAVWPLVESMQAAGIDTTTLPSFDQLSEYSLRISWDQFLSILSMADAHFSPEQLKAIGASGLESIQYAPKVKLAKALLTLEDAYRFIVYPHRILDYSCIQSAVATEPGEVRITSILLEDYTPSKTFFLLMQGAVEALPKLYGVHDTKFSGDISGRHMHFSLRFEPNLSALARAKQQVSGWIHTAYCALNQNQADDQLVRRTFALEAALKERDEARRALSLDRIDNKRRMANLTEVVAEYDHLNQLTYLSPNGEKVFGYPNNVLRNNPFQILLPKDRAAADAFFANPLNLPAGVYPMQGLHANGTVLELEVAIRHFEHRNGHQQWNATFRDVTSRKLGQNQGISSTPPISVDPNNTSTSSITAVPPARVAADAALPRLILADDDAITRRITSKILQRAGYHVVCVEDGTSVLREMNRTPVDCLVLDINMPGLTGLEVYEKIQVQDRKLPGVFVSGDTRQLTMKYPQLPTVNKPFRSEHLIEVIREALAA